MKKAFRTYAVIWAIVLAVFNVVCFVTPNEVAGISKFGGAFWTGYIFITAAFIGQLICAFLAFRANCLTRLVYNIPMLQLSYTGLIVMLIAGGLTMAIPNLPGWVGIIVCVLVLAFTAIAVIKAKTASGVVERVDEKIKAQTNFIKLLTAEAEGLINQARSGAVRADCKRVYEAIRYSDPMSRDELAQIEAQIIAKMSELTAAVCADDDAKVSELAENMILLAGERNRKCKLLK